MLDTLQIATIVANQAQVDAGSLDLVLAAIRHMRRRLLEPNVSRADMLDSMYAISSVLASVSSRHECVLQEIAGGIVGESQRAWDTRNKLAGEVSRSRDVKGGLANEAELLQAAVKAASLSDTLS